MGRLWSDIWDIGGLHRVTHGETLGRQWRGSGETFGRHWEIVEESGITLGSHSVYNGKTEEIPSEELKINLGISGEIMGNSLIVC